MSLLKNLLRETYPAKSEFVILYGMNFGRFRRIHFQIISYTTYKESFKSYFNGIVADIAIYSTQSGR